METMKRNKGFEWFKWLLVILLISFMFSCGAKKKSLEVIKTKTETKKDLSAFKHNDILSSFLINKVDTKITLEPINPNNPIILNDSTSIQNARVVIEEKKDNSHIEIRDKSKVEIKDKGVERVEKKEKIQHKEKEGVDTGDIKWSIWGSIMLIIIGTIIFRFRHRIFGRRDSNTFD